ncbi:MAG TPA: adenylosuccinate synthetase, partial [Acholeplasmataceae bacterium]|nr:adenylosuccinate synthetase [Acholeplasmataceae bacterium]
SELPVNAQKYLEKIEELVGVEIGIFSVGPAREQTIQVKDFF